MNNQQKKHIYMNKFAKSSNVDKEGKYVSLPDWQKRKTICKWEKCQNC